MAIVLEQDGSGRIELYLNGELQSSTVSADTLVAGPVFLDYTLYLGARAGSSVFLAGGIDDLRIYNRELSAGEITAIATTGTAGQGPLGNPTTEPKARAYYVASYPDAIGRAQATANYGTNPDSVAISETVPERSDEILVQSFSFDRAGNLADQRDAMGTVTHQEYDAAGRRIAVVENYQEGGPVAADVNRTTNFEYNLDGNLTKQTAVNAGTGNQETGWEYGVAIGGGESDLASKGLVGKKTYPDGGEVTFTYNRAGQVTTLTDQNGTVHAYGYDELGRLTSDEASIAEGSAIDLSVKKITRSYEVRGMLAKVSSLDDGDGFVNDVLLVYNDFSQLYRDYQAHAGEVNTSTTLRVQYGYFDGSDNTIRPLAITYPSTSGYDFRYGDTDSAADALSRPEAITDSLNALCRYRYLGLATNVGVIYDNAAGAELTYENGGSGDAGDKYTGLDRFGRLVETIWQKANNAVPPVMTTLVHSTYGRNRFGGVVWRYDALAHAQSPSPVTDQDNFYTYDGLYQVKQHQRGDLGGGGPPYTEITSPDQQEDWTYDPTGNWNAYHNVAGMLDNQQTRAHNAANEITEITAPNPIGSVNPVYDNAGNMTTLPTEPGVSTDTTPLVWDAWNRLVSFTTESPFAMEYQYDGLTRRTVKFNTDTADERHFYYNRQWRPVEEWLDNSVEISYIWGLRDRWDLVGANLISVFRVCLRDYLDPVALADASGEVQERMGYDAFGNVRYMDADFGVVSPFATGWAFFFHGEFLDGESGLYNYGFRYYIPSLGRWSVRDPLNTHSSIERYSFCRNSGVNLRDQFGLASAGTAARENIPVFRELAKILSQTGGGASIDFIPLSPTEPEPDPEPKTDEKTDDPVPPPLPPDDKTKKCMEIQKAKDKSKDKKEGAQTEFNKEEPKEGTEEYCKLPKKILQPGDREQHFRELWEENGCDGLDWDDGKSYPDRVAGHRNSLRQLTNYLDKWHALYDKFCKKKVCVCVTYVTIA